MRDKRKKQSSEKHQPFNIKRNRMEGKQNAEFATRKTIVDINYDCLEYVFEFLEFCDLINVADANKHIKVSADVVFARKLKKRLIIVEIDPELKQKGYPDIGVFNDAISIHTSLLAVRSIRNFGPRITGIHLRIDTNDSLREKFFLHVNEYCHETLNILQIFGDHSNIFSAVEHPFGNVEQFSSYYGVVGPGCEKFNRIFPRLRQLKFIDNEILDFKCIAQTYPNLDTFAFNYIKFPQNFIDSNLITITTLNPQIQSFEFISYQNKPRIWELISTQLQNLKSVHASYWLEHANCFKGSPIQFNNVEIFNARSGIGFSVVNPIDVFSFRHLKKLTVKCKNNGQEMWLDFVLSHPTIEELELCIFACSLWRHYEKMFEQIRQKMNKVSQNTKFISLQLDSRSFHEPTFPGETLKLLKFLVSQKWFNKVSVMFDFRNSFFALSRMQDFTKNIQQICEKKLNLRSFPKMYNIKTNILSYISHVDFEKCEQ